MLDDRSPTVQSVKSIGSEFSKIADKVEKRQAQEHLRDLTLRWDKLTQSQAERQEALSAALEASRLFTERVVPFLEWLEPTEKKVAAMETVEPNAKKILQQIENQQVS